MVSKTVADRSMVITQSPFRLRVAEMGWAVRSISGAGRWVGSGAHSFIFYKHLAEEFQPKHDHAPPLFWQPACTWRWWGLVYYHGELQRQQKDMVLGKVVGTV